MGPILLKFQPSHFLLFALLSNFLLVFCYSSSHIKCRSEEKTALLLFRSHFSCMRSYDNCSYSSALNWKEDEEDCCEWDGVSCANNTGYVVGLDLMIDRLYGKFPLNSSLFNLIHLESLHLSFNDFDDSQISPLFRNLQNLTFLSLSYSEFSGVVPNEIFQLLNLQVLDLHYNRGLSGKLPDSIGELASLQELYLEGCNFSGPIPESIRKLTQLSRLDLSENRFTGTIDLDLFLNLSSLSYLILSENRFTGTIDLDLFLNLSSLSYLILSENRFTGTIDLDLFLNLSGLTYLDLSENNFTGTIDLDLFIQFHHLEYLILSNSGLSVTTNNLNLLSVFPNITEVGLSSCNLSTNILANLTAHSQLSGIDLSNNKIGNKLDPSICNLPYLYYLDLSNNQFHGRVPDCLGNSNGSLSMLNLGSNKFDGIIPQSLGNSKNLQLLDLSSNVLQGSLPRSLTNCSRLEVLNLGGNMLTDGFPFWLGNLSSLRVVILRENKLFGTMSKSPRMKQDQFQSMHIIDMSKNDFTGTFPTMFFDSWNSMMIGEEEEKDISTYAFIYVNLTAVRNIYEYSLNIMDKGLLIPYKKVPASMKVIDFSSNKFHGSIPPSIGRLKGIQVLNLSGNYLSGQIPWFIGNLTSLESLDLSNNMFSGEIPLELSNLNFLEDLDISQNNLSGAIPGLLTKFPNSSYEGNQGLCGLPLSRLCGNADKPNSPPKSLPSKKKPHFEFNLNRFGWEVVVVGYGVGILFGLVGGYFIPVRNNPWFARTFNFRIHQSGRRARNSRSG